MKKLNKEEPLTQSRKRLAKALLDYTDRFGDQETIYLDDFPVSFNTELELNTYLIQMHERCLKEGKPLRAYVTPASATFEFKEGIIYK